MSIATAIADAQQKVANAYLTVSNKGGTLPASRNLSNLSVAINSIPSGGGTSPVIQQLDITPTTSSQVYNPVSGVDGYGPVNVSAVTSAIDNNILATNIKSGVSILGVTGNVVESVEDTLSVTPSTSAQTFTPTSPYTGYNQINVSAVTSSIDNNIQAGNIKSGVNILGVIGTYSGGGNNDIASYQITNGTASKISKSLSGTEFNDILTIDSYGMDSIFKNKLLTGQVNFQNVTQVNSYGLNETFYGNSGITSALFPSLTTVNANSMYQTFVGNSIVNVDLSNLTTIGDHGMYNCFSNNNISGILDLSLLVTVDRYGLYGCFGKNNGTGAITGINVSSLTTLGVGAMTGCFSGQSSLTGNIYFTSLTNLSSFALNQCFSGSSIQGLILYFPAITSNSFVDNNTNCFNMMLRYATNCTVHFPSNLQSVIGSWSDVTNGFSGTNTTVLFDLPATE